MKSNKLENDIKEIAISVLVSTLNELSRRYNFSGVEVLDYIKEKGTIDLIKNESTLFCLKDESLNTCVDLFDGKITLEDIWG